MKYKELARKLKALGCVPDRYAKGSHEIWININTGARTTVPNWGSKDLKTGTISGILRDLGISDKDMENK